MHVAICDDNGADRKQLERLLKRESDKRAAVSGVLYIDSYGNAPALLSNPLQYDVIYIDMCKTPDLRVDDLVRDLIGKGVHVPIVLCCSGINYREMDFSFCENILFLDKDIPAAELSETVSKAIEYKNNAPSLIELRDEKGTTYVKEDEILYAVAKGSASVIVTLTDGRTLLLRAEIPNLYSQWASHDTFLPPLGNFILNCRYITRIGFMSATMTDGRKFPLKRLAKSCAEEIIEDIKQTENPEDNN